MKLRDERGVALVLALVLMSTLSILAASLMFLSQTETYSSMNFKMISQARYGAEAGIERAANFLYDPAQYAKPVNVRTDPLWNYSVSPVTYNGQAVVLSANPAVASYYPDPAVVTAFKAVGVGQGSITSAGATVSYKTVAKLISMQTFDPYGGTVAGTPGVVQTWEISSDGTLAGARTATVHVVAMAEQPVWPANSYGAFATAVACGALYFHGDVTIDSYNSMGMTGTTQPTVANTGGNVGTNGNLHIQGDTDILGSLYTPRTGVGTCTSGAIDALSITGNQATVTGGMVQLPAVINYPTPPAPNPMPSTKVADITSVTNACSDLGFSGATAGWCQTTTVTTPGNGNGNGNGSTTSYVITIDSGGAPISLPTVKLGAQVTLEITAHGAPAQMVNINSLDLKGGGTLAVKTTANNQSVLLNVAGKNPNGTDMSVPVDFGGNTNGGQFGADICATCSIFDASQLQLIYAGTQTLNLRGTSQASGTIYAPNATIGLYGTADIYGSVLGRTIENNGNANIHYDRRLSHDFYVEGRQMFGTFTWSRF